VYAGENWNRRLQQIIDVLNTKPSPKFVQPRTNLLQLIDEWQKSGDLNRMKFPQDCPSLWQMQAEIRVFLSPTSSRRAYVTWAYGPRKRAWTAWDHAASWFIQLITNPECERLGGPCPRCGKYFVRAGAKEKTYCSRECASVSSALESTKLRRAKEHADRLLRAENAIKRYRNNTGRWESWKDCVTASEPDISKKFLTRAVNSGELSAPQQRR